MRNSNFLSFVKSIFFMQIFVLIIVLGLSMDISYSTWSTLIADSLKGEKGPTIGLKITKFMAQNMVGFVNVSMGGQTDIDHLSANYLGNQFAENLFVSSINALAYSNDNSSSNYTVPASNDDIKLPAIKSENEDDGILPVSNTIPSNSKVIFYCTHTSETYIPDSGNARNNNGKRGLITKVAAGMAANLEKKGLAADYINTVHDWPEYNQSYVNSRKTVKDLISKDDSKILALFDVHRDSIPGLNAAETVTINGKKSAPILIVVGTDERKEHPNWKKNLDFANKIYQQSQAVYPGLIKGVRTKAGTYNQEYHDHALLLEMGSDYNSLAEAEYAGQLFAELLIQVLEKEVN
jgi:stage II sporulation protein P